MKHQRLMAWKLLLSVVALLYLLALAAWLAGDDLSPYDLWFGAFSFLALTLAISDLCMEFARSRKLERTMEQKLKNRDEALDALFLSVSMPVVVMDPDGTLVRSNEAARRLGGRTEEEVNGFSFRDFIHPDYLQETATRFQRTLEGNVQSFHSVFFHRNGNGVPIQLTTIPVSEEDRRVTRVIAVYEDMSRKRQIEDHIRQMAYYDDMTGLPNRRMFRETLSAQLQGAGDRTRIYVILLNVDRFKLVNSSLGQDIGDAVLLQLADRLHRAVAEEGMAARMEGDEFALMVRDAGGSRTSGQIVRRIFDQLETPFAIQEFTIHITTSVGVAIGHVGGEDETVLIKRAGIALSKAKETGKNHYEIFQQTMDDTYFSQFTLENDLRKAFYDGEFVLMYQPQFRIRTGEWAGTEALIRWRHPTRGLVSPGEFIPLAEETGLIVPLSEWVIREACRQNKQWQSEGLRCVPVSVNVSMRQFQQLDLTDRIASILQETGLEPRYLELEITESMTMDVEFARVALRKLRELGVRVAIDDFGTGYSSLNYLKNFPVDKLKIDRSFVRDILYDPNDAAIVRTIVAMAHQLQQCVIAEGVESEEQLAYLRSCGCDEVQGFLFSPPVFPDLLREKIMSWEEAAAASGGGME